MKYLLHAMRHPRDYRWLALRPFQRHSLVLTVAGGVYVTFGIALATTEPTPDRVSGLRLALAFAPLQVWGGLWAVVGLLAIISSRWPPASKTWGYAVLTGMAVCWAGMYACGVWLLGAPASALNGTLVWGLVAFLWWAIAGLVNPDDVLATIAAALDDRADP